jgi:hypothetical protein
MKAKQAGIARKPSAGMIPLVTVVIAMMLGGAAGIGLCTFLNAKGAS